MTSEESFSRCDDVGESSANGRSALKREKRDWGVVLRGST